MPRKEPDPSTPTAAYEYMMPMWDIIDTLLGGTGAMRAAGEKYLPRHTEEESSSYAERLEMTVLYNKFEQTLDELSGRPFSDPIKLGEDIPPEIQNLLGDIDLEGNNLDTFCRQWFRTGFGKAFCHVLVEMPRIEEIEGQRRTRADDLRENVRPYWVLIDPEDVVAMYSEVVDGQERLTHVRIREVQVEQVGFEEVSREFIRVLEPGCVDIWEKQIIRKKAKWTLVDTFNTGLDKIPLITFYSSRLSLGFGKPPLLDLAYLNVTHWQSTSDQRNILTVSRFPMLAVSGVDEDEANEHIKIGPKRLLTTSLPESRYYYVEAEGNAIISGSKDLEALEKQMESYGSQFLDPRGRNVTATEKLIDTAQSMSILQALILVFEDSVSRALDLTAEWLGVNSGKGGTIELNRDLGAEGVETATLQTLDNARTRGDISRETYLTELKRREVLKHDFDSAKDKVLLDKEPKLPTEKATT